MKKYKSLCIILLSVLSINTYANIQHATLSVDNTSCTDDKGVINNECVLKNLDDLIQNTLNNAKATHIENITYFAFKITKGKDGHVESDFYPMGYAGGFRFKYDSGYVHQYIPNIHDTDFEKIFASVWYDV